MKTYLDMELALYATYLTKPFLALKTLFTNPIGLMISLPSLTYLTQATDVTKAWYLLALVYILDFITGIYASFVEAKRNDKFKEEFSTKNTYWQKIGAKIKLLFDTISSEKLRKSIVKAIAYLLLILLVFFVEKTFLIKAFQLISISDKQWTITLIAQGICIGIEMYSIFLENLKRAGFDIVGNIIGMFKKFNTVKKQIKEEE